MVIVPRSSFLAWRPQRPSCTWHVSEDTPRDWTVLDARMRPRLQRVALRVLGNTEDAEDAVQDTFFRAWKGSDTVRDPAALEGWMCRIARNVAIDYVRRRNVRYAEMLHESPIDHRVPEPELAHALTEAIDRLPATQRRVLTDFVAGYGTASIARREGVSCAAVKTRLSRLARVERGRISRRWSGRPDGGRPGDASRRHVPALRTPGR